MVGQKLAASKFSSTLGLTAFGRSFFPQAPGDWDQALSFWGAEESSFGTGVFLGTANWRE